ELAGTVTRSTQPEVGSILGVSTDLGSPLLNGADGRVAVSVTSAGSFVLFAAPAGFLQGGTTYKATAFFTNGSRYVGMLTLPNPLPSADPKETTGPTFSVANLNPPSDPDAGAGETVGPTISVANVAQPPGSDVGPAETVGQTFSVANLVLAPD